MILWRVSEFADLEGRGGLRFKGRWHRAGSRIVYTAEHSALALLESLVRLEVEQEPADYQLLQIEAPNDLAVAHYPDDQPPADRVQSREWGEQWLAALEAPLASVPSVVAPGSRNVLVNPLHPDASRIAILRNGRYQWDPRLYLR